MENFEGDHVCSVPVVRAKRRRACRSLESKGAPLRSRSFWVVLINYGVVWSRTVQSPRDFDPSAGVIRDVETM